MYRWAFGDLRTGGVIREVDLIGGKFTTRFDATGTLGASFPLAASREVPPSGLYGDGIFGGGPYGIGASGQRADEWAEAWSASAEAKSYIAVAWVDGDYEHWIEAGPVWARQQDDDTSMMDLSGAGLESYYEHRRLVQALADMQTVATSTITYTAAELSLIAKRLVELAHSHTGGALPVILPSDAALGGAGTTHERTYPGYEVKNLGEALRDLTKVIDGPEVQFVPRRRTDDPRYLEWEMRIGTPATDMMLYQFGGIEKPWVLDRTVPKGPVKNVRVSSDASKMAFRRFGTGQGQGEGRPVRVVSDTSLVDAGYPLLEGETSSPSASELATIEGNAAGELSRTKRPGQTITITCEAAGFWKACPSFRSGDFLSLVVKDHPILGTGPVALRSVALSGGGDTVEIQCAERLGDV